MKKRTVAFFLILTTSISFSGMNIFAKSISELKKENEEVSIQRQEAEERLNETQTQKNAALEESKILDQELDKATKELEDVEDELLRTKENLAMTENDLDEAIILREKQYETFKQRLKVLYENGDMGYLDVILEAESVVDLMQRVEYLNYIVDYDNDMLNNLMATEELIAEKLSEIEDHKEEVEVLVYEQGIKKQNLETKVEEKIKLIKQLEQNEDTYLQQIEELDESSESIKQLILEAEAEEARRQAALRANSNNNYSGYEYTAPLDSAVYENGGTFALPVPGRTYISSGYGYRGSPISGKSEFHTGIDIPAPTGTSVVAVEGGVVISSGWRGGYGNTVVISHGNGMSTLYAHNSRLVVSAGDTVTRGQVISKAGSTGYSTGPHVHFEVRVNGQHVNPRKYVNI